MTRGTVLLLQVLLMSFSLVLLMTFSVVLWLVGNPGLAGLAGSTAIGLGAEVVRRFLGGSGNRGGEPAPRR